MSRVNVFLKMGNCLDRRVIDVRGGDMLEAKCGRRLSRSASPNGMSSGDEGKQASGARVYREAYHMVFLDFRR